MIRQKNLVVRLTTLDPFHIGGKDNPLSEADNPVAVVGSRVCIPGATLKGAYRAELERWLNDKYNINGRWSEDSLRPCLPTTRPSKDEHNLINSGKYRDKGCAYESEKGRYGDKRDNSRHQQPKDQKGICPACYLLGARGLVGFINVPFLFTDVSFEGLYSARLERVSRTVMQGTNRSYQLIPPNTVFTGEIQILVADDFLGWELGKKRPLKENSDADIWLEKSKTPDGQNWDIRSLIKFMIAERLQAIQRLGGYRSKGFGGVKIGVEEK